MNASAIIDRLERFAPVLQSAATVVSADDARWKPAPEHWSILEICCHLADEEVEDFRARIRSTLADPSAAWSSLGLEGIAENRGYNRRDLSETIALFVRERHASIAWLRALPPMTDWSRAYTHPKFGPISAGDLLASWAAHDALHLRQIAKRLHGLAARDAAGCSIRYAGEWSA